MDTGFDKLAWIYDSLVKLVFGNKLEKAQQVFLNDLPDEGILLIIGGGSGWILEEVSKHKPLLEIHYVEASIQMLKKAQARQVSPRVLFIHGTHESIPEDQKYQAVITNFFLDLFSSKDLKDIVESLAKHLTLDGEWFLTDFSAEGNQGFFRRGFVGGMYAFFRFLCGISAKGLVPFKPVLNSVGFQQHKRASFFGELVVTEVYKSMNHSPSKSS